MQRVDRTVGWREESRANLRETLQAGVNLYGQILLYGKHNQINAIFQNDSRRQKLEGRRKVRN